MRIGEERSSPRVSVRRRRRACALGVDIADDAEGFGGDEGADEVQLDEVSPTVKTALTIASSSDAWKLLEGIRWR
jgi:hypothetical protein